MNVWSWLDELDRSTRYAVRSLLRKPSFTVPAVWSLALGIALNTTMFSVVNAALLRSIGTEADALVRIGRAERGESQFRSLTYEEFAYLRDHATSFEVLTGHQIGSALVGTADGADLVSVELAADDYFRVLGAQPARGRGFTREEYRTFGGAPALVISDRFWQRRFAGARDVVGANVTVNGRPFVIVGVAPAGYAGSFPGVGTDVWLPASMSGVLAPENASEWTTLLVVGRLKPGVSKVVAQAELETLAARLAAVDARRDRTRGFVLGSARGVHPGFARIAQVFLTLLMSVVAIVLLVACANVASMLLARATARRSELAVRLACGASRTRLIVQLLIESLALAGAGGVLGVLLSIWAVRSLNGLSLATGPTGAPIFFDLGLDTRVLMFTAAVTMLTAVVFGLTPALQATRVDLASALKQSFGIGRARSRLRGALVVAQVSLCFVLLVSAALLFRSARHSAQLDLGFEPDDVVLASFDLQMLGYDRARTQAFYDALLQRVQAVPQFERSSFADFVAMAGRGGRVSLARAGAVPPPEDDPDAIAYNAISPGYLATIRVPLLQGRDFSARDAAGAPRVAIVNEAFARRLWPEQSALGKRFKLAGESGELEVVGVVRNTRSSRRTEGEPLLFFPLAQRTSQNWTLHVRTTLPATEALALLNQLTREIDPNLAPHQGRTMRDAMAFSLVPMRIGQTVFGIAGVIALVLACGGLYGLVAYTLEQRYREIGIRVALGARRAQVFVAIVGHAAKLSVIGTLLGLALAALGTRLLASLLYGVTPTDATTFAGIALLLVLVTLVAGSVAVRKALNIDPMIVLRYE